MKSDGWFYAALGERIRAARERASMSQATLGKRLAPPVSRAHVALVEGGRSRVLLLQALQYAEALGVDLRMLLPGTDPKAAKLEEARLLRERAERLEKEAADAA